MLTDPAQSKHFHDAMFHGYDFDNTMLRIGSMNMQLHGVEQPGHRATATRSPRTTPATSRPTRLVLANPPFAGSLDYESTAKDLLQVVKTKKTELLFLALFLRLLKPGGRAAVIVPDGVLFGSTKAHKELRRMLVEDQKLDGIVSLPSGVFKPYAGVSTAILLFTKTNSRRHRPRLVLRPASRRPQPRRQAHAAARRRQARRHAPTLDRRRARQEQPARRPRPLARARRQRAATGRAPTSRFCVPKADIVANGYDLQHQPLQGDRPRRDRVPRARGDPRRAH